MGALSYGAGTSLRSHTWLLSSEHRHSEGFACRRVMGPGEDRGLSSTSTLQILVLSPKFTCYETWRHLPTLSELILCKLINNK